MLLRMVTKLGAFLLFSMIFSFDVSVSLHDKKDQLTKKKKNKVAEVLMVLNKAIS